MPRVTIIPKPSLTQPMPSVVWRFRSIAMPLDFDAVVRETRAKGRGDQRQGHCPVKGHRDQNPSLSITRQADGTALVHCFKCDPGDVFRALREKGCISEPLAARNGNHAGEWVWYDYPDETGAVLYQSGRQDYPRKKFTQRRPDGAGGYVYNLNGVRRVPYKLPALIAGAKVGKTALFVEGEKHADHLTRAGFVATTFSGGAGALKTDNQPKDWPALFRGVHVCILADNDEPGKAHACRVGRALVGVAKSVRVIKALPGVGHKGDVLNWWDPEQGRDANALRELIRAAPEYEPQPGDDTEAYYSSPSDAVANTVPNAGTSEPLARRGPVPLSEYLTRPELLTPPQAFVPRLAFKGRSTLFAALFKAGKTTLMCQACAATTRAGEFLSDQLDAPQTVLWYAIDEPLGDTVRRFNELGADPTRVYIVDEPPTALEMREDIQATGATVVVVDTMISLWGDGFDENNASDMAPRMRPFIAIPRELDVALVLLHHTGRSGMNYRGSAHFGAAVDVIVTMHAVNADAPDGSDDPTVEDVRRILKGKGRGGIHFHDRLTFDGTRYVLGEAPPSLELRTLRAVLDAPASMSKVAKDVGVRKDRILELMPKLMREGFVRQIGSGKDRQCELTDSGRLVAIGAAAVPASVPVVVSDDTPGTEAGTASEPPVVGWEPMGTGQELVRNRSGTASTPLGGVSVPEKKPRGLEREPHNDSPDSDVFAFTIS